MAQAGRAKNGTTLNMLITKKKQEYQYKKSICLVKRCTNKLIITSVLVSI